MDLNQIKDFIHLADTLNFVEAVIVGGLALRRVEGVNLACEVTLAASDSRRPMEMRRIVKTAAAYDWRVKASTRAGARSGIETIAARYWRFAAPSPTFIGERYQEDRRWLTGNPPRRLPA